MALNEVWKPSYDGGAEILEGIKISFHHVQRVEDNFSPSHQKVTTVPVRTTAFPLRRGKDSEDDSPFFLAMEEWNGVAISATSSGYGQEFKLEISVGTVNVANQITGMNKQDYFVVSDESLWVDGVSIDLERVRQFVALGPSTKAGIERQLKDVDLRGGFNIKVYPTDRYFQLRGLKDVPLVPQDDQSIPVFLVCSPSSVKAIHVHLSDTVLQLKTRIYEVVKIPPIYQFLICPRHNSKRGRIENDGLGEFDMTLEEFGIQKGMKIHVVSKGRGGSSESTEPWYREMVLCPGGLIAQTVGGDEDVNRWHTEPLRTLRITVVNTETFRQITGESGGVQEQKWTDNPHCSYARPIVPAIEPLQSIAMMKQNPSGLQRTGSSRSQRQSIHAEDDSGNTKAKKKFSRRFRKDKKSEKDRK